MSQVRPNEYGPVAFGLVQPKIAKTIKPTSVGAAARNTRSFQGTFSSKTIRSVLNGAKSAFLRVLNRGAHSLDLRRRSALIGIVELLADRLRNATVPAFRMRGSGHQTLLRL